MNDSMKIRMNNNNILVADVDPVNHALSGNIYDEETDQSYPVGGGGASIKNPKLTITVNNPTANGVNIDVFIQEIDGNLTPVSSDIPISIHRETKTVTGYALYQAIQEAYYCQMDWSTSSLTYTSTLTNCTILDDGDGVFIIVVTDPTQEASAELVFTTI